MKIPREFKQFEGDKVLLVVAGEQAAEFFFAHNGEIEHMQDMKIENPHYSDREGFFIKSGHGDRYASGSVYEAKDDKVRIDFINDFQEKIKELVKDKEINKLYLFAPQHVLHDTEEALPYGVRELRVDSYAGNFMHSKPFELLEKIKTF